MTEPIVIQPIYMRSIGDCCICCLSMLLGKTYAEVLGACPRKISVRRIIEEGLTDTQMVNVARRLGVPLVTTQSEPEEDAVGMLYLERKTNEDAHVVMYFKDSVYNPAANEIWTDVGAFLTQGSWTIKRFLWRKK